MRLWTLHPKYLDPQGLVALWREALLARAVLRGETRGYKAHPQLDRFRSQPDTTAAINAYLASVFEESRSRGYSFDASKVESILSVAKITVTSGQIDFEWRHLRSKLLSRSPLIYEKWHRIVDPVTISLFRTIPGEIEPWERLPDRAQ
jgi:hypothetical protein